MIKKAEKEEEKKIYVRETDSREYITDTRSKVEKNTVRGEICLKN